MRKMRDARLLVEFAPDSMPLILPDDSKAERGRVRVNCLTDVDDAAKRLNRSNAEKQCVECHLNQPLGFRGDLADEKRF